MAANLHDFEALRAAGTTFVIDDGTGIDWIFLNGTCPAVPGHSGPDTTMALHDGTCFATFGLVTAVTVWDSATITFARPIENIRDSASDDRITGNDLANVLLGDATDVAGGADWPIGRLGHDRLLGGLGDDIAYVTDARTVVCELEDQGTDLVITSVSFPLGANVENLTMPNASFPPPQRPRQRPLQPRLRQSHRQHADGPCGHRQPLRRRGQRHVARRQRNRFPPWRHAGCPDPWRHAFGKRPHPLGSG